MDATDALVLFVLIAGTIAAVIMLSLLVGSIVLWALNILGFFEPFTLAKAFAIGVIINILTGGVKFKKA